jgi:hypothetical protein
MFLVLNKYMSPCCGSNVTFLAPSTRDLLEFGKEIPQDIEISAIYATWAVALRCYTGMDTIHFKTFDSFRNGPDMFFQESGCLQLKLNGNATVGDLIRTVEIYSTELNTSCNCDSYQQKYNVEFQEALSKTGIIVSRASKTEVRDSKESLQTGDNEVRVSANVAGN